MQIRRFICCGLVVLAMMAVAAVASAQSSSTNFRLDRSTVNGGGGTSTSPAGTNYRLSASFGQQSTIGTSSSFDYVLQSGFWSYQGSGLVPVVLTATKNGSNPANPDLAWTGNNAPYVLYATAGCSNVTSGFLTTTSSLTWTDVAPPAGSLACYTVFATAPGPIAPAGGIAPDADGTLTRKN